MTLVDGRKIYHTYKDQGEITVSSWYTTDEDEDLVFEFDVRELSTYRDKDLHEVIIQNAVNLGEVKFPV